MLSSSSTKEDTALEQASNITSDLARIRALIQPEPILGLENWGIPEASKEPCDPNIEVQ